MSNRFLISDAPAPTVAVELAAIQLAPGNGLSGLHRDEKVRELCLALDTRQVPADVTDFELPQHDGEGAEDQ